MRFKTNKELLESSATMVLTAMDIEWSAVHQAIKLPKEVTEFFLPCITSAVVGAHRRETRAARQDKSLWQSRILRLHTGRAKDRAQHH